MLDRSRPYCEVHGNGRRLLAQDGRCYNLDGHEVPDPDAPESTTAPEGAVMSGELPGSRSVLTELTPVTETVPPIAFPAVTQMAERARVFPADDMRLKENRQLKEQMTAFGEEWLGADHARAFLAGRIAPDE